MAVIEKQQFVFTSAGLNSNKCWIIELHDNGDVVTSWGRIGDSLQKKSFPGLGKVGMEKKIREKTKPSSHYDGGCYRKVDTLDSTSDTSITVKGSLKEIAKKQITSCKVTSNLIEYFTDVNAHNISYATGSKIQFNIDSGLFKTPLGIVTKKSIYEARNLLSNIANLVQTKKFGVEYKKSVDNYLMLIPQKVDKKFDPVSFMGSQEKIKLQDNILDGLDASYASVINNPKKDNSDIKTEEPKLFNVKMSLLDDKSEFSRVEKIFNSTKKSMHYSTYGYKLKDIYILDINLMTEQFEKNCSKYSNAWELWHGTSSSNCLSILKTGFKINPPSSAYISGKMFSNGLYFSDQSTKSLNYATNFWGGKGGNRCFMFLNKVAMGNYYVPKGPTSSLPPKGFDSYFAKANESGVLNNEMIVFKEYQVKPLYLCEFS